MSMFTTDIPMQIHTNVADMKSYASIFFPSIQNKLIVTTPELLKYIIHTDTRKLRDKYAVHVNTCNTHVYIQ